AAENGRAVEITCRVGDQIGSGTSAVAAAGEAVEHVQGPRGGELEYRTLPAGAAAPGRAVEIARHVGDEPGVGIRPVAAAGAAGEHVEGPRGGQLEYRAVAASAAVVGRAVEIAGRVEDQAAVGDRPLAAGEPAEHVEGPRRRQLEYLARPVA